MPEGAVTALVTAPSAFLWGDAQTPTRANASRLITASAPTSDQTPTRANASRLMPFSSTTFDHSRALCRLWSR